MTLTVLILVLRLRSPACGPCGALRSILSIHVLKCLQGQDVDAPKLHLKVVMALEGLHAHFLHMARQRAFRHRLVL